MQKPVFDLPRIVVLVAILIISIGQSVDIYVPSMPHMVGALDTSASLIQLSMAIALISFGFSVFIYGALSDHYGRRKPILVGISIFVVGSIICFLAPDIETLLVGRAVQGCGIGCAGTTASLPKDVLSGERLIKAYSYISIAMSVVPIIAPVLGGYLQEWIGWRANFAFLALYSGIVLLLIYRILPETNKQRVGAALSFAGAGRSYLQLLKTPSTLGHLFCFMAIFAGEISYCVLLPFIAQNTFGFTPISNGWLIVITAAGLAAGGLLSSKFSRFGWDKLLLIGISIGAVGALLMLLLSLLSPPSIAAIVVPMMVYMLGAGFVYPNAIAALMSAHPERGGVMSSLLSALQMLSAGLVILFAANLSYSDQSGLSLLLVGVSLSSLLACFLMRRAA